MPTRQLPSRGTSDLDPHLAGVTCGVISAAGYTACNICLRHVADHCDPVWVSCVKAMPVAATAAVMTLRQWTQGVPLWMPGRWIAGLIGMSLLMQLGGNVGFQVALGTIGLAVVVPLSFGTILIGAALLARVWLGEPIRLRMAAAMAIVMAAIVVLSFAAGAAGRVSVAGPVRSYGLIVGVSAGCVAGLAYGCSSVVVRRAVTGGMTLSSTLLVMSSTGVVALGVASLGSVGLEGIVATSAKDFTTMLAAGSFNAVAFYTLAKSLQLMSVVHANLLNASQVAMAAVAGVVLFGETLSGSLVAGVILTGAGLLLLIKGGKRENVPAANSGPGAHHGAPLAWPSAAND